MQMHAKDMALTSCCVSLTKHNWPLSTEPTITIQELLKEILKALRGFQPDPTLGKVIQGYKDVLGVPPNIQNLKEIYQGTMASLLQIWTQMDTWINDCMTEYNKLLPWFAYLLLHGATCQGGDVSEISEVLACLGRGHLQIFPPTKELVPY